MENDIWKMIRFLPLPSPILLSYLDSWLLAASLRFWLGSLTISEYRQIEKADY